MWDEFFAEKKDVETKQGKFRVYLSAPSEAGAPLLVLLHGGGFSALSWAHFSVRKASWIHPLVLLRSLFSVFRVK